MPEVKTQLVLDAPRARVFEAFLDKSRWRQFSAMADLDAHRPIELGRRFAFSIKIPGLPRAPILVTVSRFESGAEVAWTGRVPGFGGEHYFRFSDAPGGGTLLVHGERFYGPLGDLLVALRGRQIEATYDAFNRGLASSLGVGARPPAV